MFFCTAPCQPLPTSLDVAVLHREAQKDLILMRRERWNQGGGGRRLNFSFKPTKCLYRVYIYFKVENILLHNTYSFVKKVSIDTQKNTPGGIDTVRILLCLVIHHNQ